MKKWLKWLLTIVIFAGITTVFCLIGFKGDWIKPIVEKAGVWGYLIYLILQVIITTIFCFVPATTFTFSLMSVQLFGMVGGLIISIIGCFISSMVMFFVGRFGGTKLVDWLVGKESREKVQNMVSDKALVYVPVMLACPFFPDDAVVLVSGMTTMKFWYFAPMCLITRSIGITATAFLGEGTIWNYIKDSLGNNIVLWIMFVFMILQCVLYIYKFTNWLEKKLKARRIKKQEEINPNIEKAELLVNEQQEISEIKIDEKV